MSTLLILPNIDLHLGPLAWTSSILISNTIVSPRRTALTHPKGFHVHLDILPVAPRRRKDLVHDANVRMRFMVRFQQSQHAHCAGPCANARSDSTSFQYESEMSVVSVSAVMPASPIDLPGSFHAPRTISLRPTRRGWGRIGVGGGGGVRCAQPTLLSARFCFLPR